MPSLITNLTNFANQQSILQLDDGTGATMNLLYNGTTERWTMDVLYNGFAVYGINVCCYPNLLRQYQNELPFGIACISADQTDPIDINDFANSRVLLYILTTDDVADIESTVFGAAQV